MQLGSKNRLGAFMLCLVALFLSSAVRGDIAVKPVTFVAGQVLPAASLNSDFDTIYTAVNGQLSDVNIKTGAAINPNKVDWATAVSILSTAPGIAVRTDGGGGSNICFSTGVTTDTVPRLAIDYLGRLNWGAGGASTADLRLYRFDNTKLSIRDGGNTLFRDLELRSVKAWQVFTDTAPSVEMTATTATANDGCVIFRDPATSAGVLLKRSASSLTVRNTGDTAAAPIVCSSLTGTGFSSVPYSSDQVITAAGALTLAHSLGYTPSRVMTYLVCQTGELGYTAADIVAQAPGYNGVANSGVSIVPDGTNLNVRYGSAATTFTIIRKDTGVSAAATNANWKMRFVAF